MRLIRLVHPRHYSHQKKRFSSTAFNDTDNTGISVVVEPCVTKRCVDQKNTGTCDHIRQYYTAQISGMPPVFWCFEQSMLPNGSYLYPNSYRNDDPYHTNIRAISPGEARNIIKSVAVDDMEICAPGGIRPLTMPDIIAQHPPK